MIENSDEHLGAMQGGGGCGGGVHKFLASRGHDICERSLKRK